MARHRKLRLVFVAFSVVLLGLPFSTAARASFPGDNGKIAFQRGSSNGEIFVMNADGTQQLNITNNPAPDYDPTWSPRGRSLLFTTSRDGNTEIYFMRPDGSSTRNVTQNAASDTYPSWSPSGAGMAFTSDRDGDEEIYRMQLDGSAIVNLTSDPASDFAPAYSPDGTKVAFVSDRDGDREIYVMDALDGSGLQQITTNSIPDENPTWAPDGQRLAYNTVSFYEGVPYGQLMIVDSDGTNRKLFGYGMAPAWSPDGAKIAYWNGSYCKEGDCLKGSNIHVKEVEGSPYPTRLTELGSDDRPDWQPQPYPPPIADLSITMTAAPKTLSPGESVTYTMEVKNFGPDKATFVLLSDSLPSQLTLESAVSTRGYCEGTRPVHCHLGTLRSGAVATVTLVATVMEGRYGIFKNNAEVTATELDLAPANNSATVRVSSPPPPSAALHLSMKDQPDPVAAGGTLTYTIDIDNAGPDSATDVTVTDALPPQVVFFSSAPSEGSCTGTTVVTCDLSTIPSGASAKVSIQVSPRGPGVVSNTASVRSNEDDPSPADNEATVETRVAPEGCTIIGTDGDDTLIGTSADEFICGLDGDDLILPYGGADTVLAGSGIDVIKASDGPDHLYGGAGDDNISGGYGPDFLYGDAGVDDLDGGPGTDACDPGPDGGTTTHCEST